MDPVWGSVMETCLERKSAPMVALYWPVNFLEWYRFMREVFPTLKGCIFGCFNYLLPLRVVFYCCVFYFECFSIEEDDK